MRTNAAQMLMPRCWCNSSSSLLPAASTSIPAPPSVQLKARNEAMEEAVVPMVARAKALAPQLRDRVARFERVRAEPHSAAACLSAHYSSVRPLTRRHHPVPRLLRPLAQRSCATNALRLPSEEVQLQLQLAVAHQEWEPDDPMTRNAELQPEPFDETDLWTPAVWQSFAATYLSENASYDHDRR